mmetsp:Transcript_44327/g.71007  ORF Transcript_44327/g.71007 Transcript_44327/m.71007 type:complete len:311 (+) Transcript_44327:94-1026(+)
MAEQEDQPQEEQPQEEEPQEEQAQEQPQEEEKQEEKQQPPSSDKKGLKRIVVGGATGAVGRHCVNVLVRDPRVCTVYALSRSNNAKPVDFYGLEEKSDPIDKIQHLQVDYTGDLDAQFKDLTFDAGISCLGVYTADVKNEADFRAKEYEPNLKFARAAAAHGAKRWSYLSGAGVKQTDSKAWNQPLFSWVKGCIEKDLQKVDGLEFVNAARPGFIAGRPDSNGWLEDVANYFADSLVKTKMAVHRDDISVAMVYTVLNEELGGPFVCYENEEIKVAAAAYKSDMAGNQQTSEKKNDAQNEQQPDNQNDAQ